MKDFKLIFTGPVGAGKTTAIQTVSSLIYHDCDVRVSTESALRKARTTVAMDNGVLQLGDEERVHLYGTPGQERFRFMWEILANDIAKECVGFVLLIDNSRNYPFRDLRFYMKEFCHLIGDKKFIVAVTHTDVCPVPTLDDYCSWLGKQGVTTSVALIDAREKRDVLLVIGKLLEGVSSCVERYIDSGSASFSKEAAMKEQKAVHATSVPGAELEQLRDIPTVHDVVPHVTGSRGGMEMADMHVVKDGSIAKTSSRGRPRSDERAEGEDGYVEKVVMKESIVDDVMKIRGVKSAALVSAMGDIIRSTIDDVEFNEFISFFSGIA
ncbi:MAG TPA: hypothetical protein ENJ43_06080, partial [Gammaproteobacteria bacterium]|nr:hypothetical protein [Gammaproteobacteria bacterium]